MPLLRSPAGLARASCMAGGDAVLAHNPVRNLVHDLAIYDLSLKLEAFSGRSPSPRAVDDLLMCFCVPLLASQLASPTVLACRAPIELRWTLPSSTPVGKVTGRLRLNPMALLLLVLMATTSAGIMTQQLAAPPRVFASSRSV